MLMLGLVSLETATYGEFSSQKELILSVMC